MLDTIVLGTLNINFTFFGSLIPAISHYQMWNNFELFIGGRGTNESIGLSRLQQKVALIGAIGNDKYGDQIVEALITNNVDIKLVKRIPNQNTGVMTVELSNSNNDKIRNKINYWLGANQHLLASDITPHLLFISQAKTAVTQLELSLTVVEHFIKCAKLLNLITILYAFPPRELTKELLNNLDYLIIHKADLYLIFINEFTIAQFDIERQLFSWLQKKLKSCQLKAIILLLDNHSTSVFTEQNYYSVINWNKSNNLVNNYNVATDAFVSGFTFGINCSWSLLKSVVYANYALLITCFKSGSSITMPYLEELSLINNFHQVLNNN